MRTLVSTAVLLLAACSAAAAEEMQRYESPDGCLVLYHPEGWTATEGEPPAPGMRTANVVAGDGSARVDFLAIPTSQRVENSLHLARTVIEGMRAETSDLQVTEVRSAPDRSRTRVAASCTAEDGRSWTGRVHCFHGPRWMFVYVLASRTDRWHTVLPTLTAITANLAFAAEGVREVLAREEPKPGGGSDVTLEPAAAEDGSFTILKPRGWSFAGSSLQYQMDSDPRTHRHGVAGATVDFLSPQLGLAVPGMLVSDPLPPAEALAAVLTRVGTARNLSILAQFGEEDAGPEVAQAVQEARSAGLPMDVRLVLVEFDNSSTGERTRGQFTVAVLAGAMGGAWKCLFQGGWSPAAEFAAWAPVVRTVCESFRPDPSWTDAALHRQHVEMQRSQAHLQESIRGGQQAFDRYLESQRERDRSREYTNWAFSRTTLGQGSWVSEREGAEVVRTDAWGLEDPSHGGVVGPRFNTTHFDGRNPFTGEHLNEIDTRAEYDRIGR